MKQRALIIIGASGHGSVCADIALQIGYNEIFFLDDRLSGEKIVGKIKDFEKYVGKADFFVAIGNNHIRKAVFQMLWDSGADITNLIHPNACISASVTVGKGVAVMAGTVINCNTTIGNGAIINTCSSVDHDGTVGDFVHVAVGSHIAGNVNIGERTFIGAGATVINNLDICKECTVGAGAVVTKSITEAGTYIGVPARKI